MSLKNIVTTPIYSTIIPSRNIKIKFRPFLVMDERSLLAAQESEDPVTMLNTLASVVRGCIMDEKEAANLATFDIEYLFVKIREKSVGEESTLLFTCSGCKEKTPINFPITTVEVYTDPLHQKMIKLSPTLGILMKYADIDVLTNMNMGGTPEDIKMSIVGNSIEAIYDGDEVHYTAEESIESIMQFVNRLTSLQYKKLAEFIDTTPEVRLKLEWDCPKCNTKNNEVLTGINSFF
jgi:hypothetical protein